MDIAISKLCTCQSYFSILKKSVHVLQGGKSDVSGFDDMPTSPKSPLSPNKAWEGRDSTRNCKLRNSQFHFMNLYPLIYILFGMQLIRKIKKAYLLGNHVEYVWAL